MNDDDQIGKRLLYGPSWAYHSLRRKLRNTSGLRGAFAVAGHRTQQSDSAPDPVAALVDQIKWMIRSDADPHVLMGVLAEGAIQVLVQRIPVECRQDAAEAVTQFIAGRLRSRLAT
jgi:hypothetical protein